jgi:hypothetical protein
LSDSKLELPPASEIDETFVGKTIVFFNGEQLDVGLLKTLIKDEDEITYVLQRKYGERVYVYSPSFGTNNNFITNVVYVGKKPRGYKVVKRVADLMKKQASEPGTHIHLKKKESGENNIEKYNLTISTTSSDSSSIIFPDGKPVVSSIVGSEEDNAQVEGDKTDIEHKLVGEGLTSDSISQLINEANKEGSAVMFVKEENLIKDKPNEKVEKIAESIKQTVRKYLGFDKIASFINNDNVSDVFSLHFLSKENINQFMDEVPKIESVIDHLSRYYVLRTVGLSSDSDMIDTKSLEKLLTGLYRVLKDLKKYRAIILE